MSAAEDSFVPAVAFDMFAVGKARCFETVEQLRVFVAGVGIQSGELSHYPDTCKLIRQVFWGSYLTWRRVNAECFGDAGQTLDWPIPRFVDLISLDGVDPAEWLEVAQTFPDFIAWHTAQVNAMKERYELSHENKLLLDSQGATRRARKFSNMTSYLYKQELDLFMRSTSGSLKRQESGY